MLRKEGILLRLLQLENNVQRHQVLELHPNVFGPLVVLLLQLFK